MSEKKNRPRRNLDLVTFGESMVMYTPPARHSLRDAETLSAHVGGAESNVAMYLAELGYEVEWGGAVGEDPFGEIVLAALREAGVGVASAKTLPARTGIYFKSNAREQTAIHYYRDGSAATMMDASLFGHPEVADTKILHLTGITAALSPSCRDLVTQGTVHRALPNALVSFDVNYRPALWHSDSASEVITPLADASDIVFVGLDEAHALWGCRSIEAIRTVLPSPRTVVVKNDAIGATSMSAAAQTFVASPRVDVVEPVGAGDAFAAGYLAGTLAGLPETSRLRMGHLVASRALTVTSDYTNLPPLEWFERYVGLTEPDWEALDFRVV